DGTGGPGYKFDDEAFEGEYTRGVLAMANAGPNTNGSQFFIMHEDSPSLPKDYVIFGTVTTGLSVVDAIANAPVSTNLSGEKSKPVTPVIVNSVTITESPKATPTIEPTEEPTPTPSETTNEETPTETPAP
ncbi:MAG TPA: peptidylprolyl isomerase, partial [Candidatus Woesebacteria bacterium]|nr:peptidylprolyl isomerase [Candidatus Woesebacteria bacterium]